MRVPETPTLSQWHWVADPAEVSQHESTVFILDDWSGTFRVTVESIEKRLWGFVGA